MKRLLLFICFFATLLRPVHAAAPADLSRMEVSDITLRLEENNRMIVTFDLETGKKMLNSRSALTLTPVIQNDNMTISLPGIVIQGRQAAKYEQRRALSHTPQDTVGKTIIRAGQTLRYNTEVRYDAWMSGAELSFDMTLSGCNAKAALEPEIFASNILSGDTMRIVKVIELPAEPPRLTAADLQAQKHTFVAPIGDFERARQSIVEGVDFDDNMLLHLGKAVGNGKQAHVEEFVERNRPGSLILYFRQGKSVIDKMYRSNYVSQEKLVESVRAIESSPDSRVERVIIAGFASPEGILWQNDLLAWNRALAVKQFLLDNSDLQEDKIRVYNGSEDWLGLRRMVRDSDLPENEQAEILSIIESYAREENPGEMGRLNRLKQLNEGRTYRYLLDEYFPELRNAAYIKVYYRNLDPQ